MATVFLCLQLFFASSVLQQQSWLQGKYPHFGQIFTPPHVILFIVFSLFVPLNRIKKQTRQVSR
jgi:hypothetical protein